MQQVMRGYFDCYKDWQGIFLVIVCFGLIGLIFFVSLPALLAPLVAFMIIWCIMLHEMMVEFEKAGFTKSFLVTRSQFSIKLSFIFFYLCILTSVMFPEDITKTLTLGCLSFLFFHFVIRALEIVGILTKGLENSVGKNYLEIRPKWVLKIFNGKIFKNKK